MKITFTCKLTMSDEFEDSVVEEVYPIDAIVEDIANELKQHISRKGIVKLSETSLAIN